MLVSLHPLLLFVPQITPSPRTIIEPQEAPLYPQNISCLEQQAGSPRGRFKLLFHLQGGRELRSCSCRTFQGCGMQERG